jgi:hypothetical protein
MAETKVESQCRAAREHIKEAITALSEAAWSARDSSSHELDKALTAVSATLEGSQLLLISLPRLKG